MIKRSDEVMNDDRPRVGSQENTSELGLRADTGVQSIDGRAVTSLADLWYLKSGMIRSNDVQRE